MLIWYRPRKRRLGRYFTTTYFTTTYFSATQMLR